MVILITTGMPSISTAQTQLQDDMMHLNVKTISVVTEVLELVGVATRNSDKLRAINALMAVGKPISVCHHTDPRITTKRSAWLTVRKIKIAVSP